MCHPQPSPMNQVPTVRWGGEGWEGEKEGHREKERGPVSLQLPSAGEPAQPSHAARGSPKFRWSPSGLLAQNCNQRLPDLSFTPAGNRACGSAGPCWGIA